MSGQLLIGDVFRAAARGVPQRVAAALGARQITFGELDRVSDQLAHSMVAVGVGHGDRIVTWSVTHLDLCALFAAAAKVGAVFAPA
ncbi:MAG TPA: AMP-binding protein, partial [Ilumatobacteraceae bacterium]|nr:AMP-binding protein [Ilumatobacteraceae bacterium]